MAATSFTICLTGAVPSPTAVIPATARHPSVPYANGDDRYARLPRPPAIAGSSGGHTVGDTAPGDLGAKLAGVPLWKLLGLERGGPLTSWPLGIGDPEETARKAERAAPRFKRLKLKLGAGDGLDVDRVRAVRSVTNVPLQVDVNEGWTLEEALAALPQLAALDVH